MQFTVTTYKDKNYEKYYFTILHDKMYHESEHLFSTMENALHAGWQAVWTVRHFENLKKSK